MNRPNSDLSFYVGGYSAKSGLSEVWLIRIDAAANQCADAVCIRAAGQPGIMWGGQPGAIYRLLMGVGMRHEDALKSAGLNTAQAAAASRALLANLEAPLLHPAMPVQDAIDLADFLIETTKRFVRFLPGADTVGGDTDIAVVTKHEGYKWVRRKHYFNSILNPAEVPYASKERAAEANKGESSGDSA